MTGYLSVFCLFCRFSMQILIFNKPLQNIAWGCIYLMLFTSPPPKRSIENLPPCLNICSTNHLNFKKSWIILDRRCFPTFFSRGSNQCNLWAIHLVSLCFHLLSLHNNVDWIIIILFLSCFLLRLTVRLLCDASVPYLYSHGGFEGGCGLLKATFGDSFFGTATLLVAEQKK